MADFDAPSQRSAAGTRDLEQGVGHFGRDLVLVGFEGSDRDRARALRRNGGRELQPRSLDHALRVQREQPAPRVEQAVQRSGVYGYPANALSEVHGDLVRAPDLRERQEVHALEHEFVRRDAVHGDGRRDRFERECNEIAVLDRDA